MNYLAIIPPFVWLLISTIFFAIGEFLSKKWGINPSWALAIWVVVLNAISAFLWLPSLLNHGKLSIMGIMWTLLGAILTVSIGIFIFHEEVTIIQTIGIVLAITSLVLLGI